MAVETTALASTFVINRYANSIGLLSPLGTENNATITTKAGIAMRKNHGRHFPFGLLPLSMMRPIIRSVKASTILAISRTLAAVMAATPILSV